MKLVYMLAVNLFLSLALAAQTMPQGIGVSDAAPDFTAKDQDGKIFYLKNELKNGSVVMVFYRGQWCPYCNRQLKELQDSIGLIRARGANLIAVSPELPANINKTIEKTKADYPVIFDDGLKIMSSYQVAFAVDTSTIERYKKFGIDFNEANGSNGPTLPVPAVYIVNKQGVVVFKHFDPDYRKRVSVREILQHL